MAKVHGDFGDLSRYSVEVGATGASLICDDCDRIICSWVGDEQRIALDEITRAASEHETAEEEIVPDGEREPRVIGDGI